MRAAVLQEIGQDKLEVFDDVEATGFGPGKVRIRVRATGLCRSDWYAWAGHDEIRLPHVPGTSWPVSSSRRGRGVALVGR